MIFRLTLSVFGTQVCTKITVFSRAPAGKLTELLKLHNWLGGIPPPHPHPPLGVFYDLFHWPALRHGGTYLPCFCDSEACCEVEHATSDFGPLTAEKLHSVVTILLF